MPKKEKFYLRLRNYLVEHIHYEFNENFKFLQEQVQISPTFGRKIEQLDNVLYKVSLKVEIPKENSPFFVDVQIAGYFEIDKDLEEQSRKVFLEENAIAILFPFLRSIVAQVTSNGSLPPYVIPVMNITEMIDKK